MEGKAKSGRVSENHLPPGHKQITNEVRTSY